MAEPLRPDWIWLASGAIDEFKMWRILDGATAASAASYSTGARKFVRYCRKVERKPSEAIDSFDDHLAQLDYLAASSRSDYRSHARAFVKFLDGRVGPGPSAPNSAAKTAGMSEPIRPKISSVGPYASRSRPGRAVDIPASVDADVPGWIDQLGDASTPALLAGYARTIAVLRARGVIRTSNAPLGDYAEWLVWRAVGGTIEPNSTKSHDVTDTFGRRLQVKARLVSSPPTAGQLQTSVFRSWDFDFVVLVQLAERDYSVVRASMLPARVFEGGRANTRWSQHVKGWLVMMTPAIMGHGDAIDMTDQLQSVASTA